jgi:hypothetical protein
MSRVAARDEADEALHILLADEMMKSIARGGCYRVRVNDRLGVESPDPLAGRRLRFIDLVDYASDREVTACVDLDRSSLTSLRCRPAEARLAPAEEADALTVALADRRVAAGIALGDQPQSIVRVGGAGAEPHHRSAAVTFGAARSTPSLVAIVDLARRSVTKILPHESI